MAEKTFEEWILEVTLTQVALRGRIRNYSGDRKTWTDLAFLTRVPGEDNSLYCLSSHCELPVDGRGAKLNAKEIAVPVWNHLHETLDDQDSFGDHLCWSQRELVIVHQYPGGHFAGKANLALRDHCSFIAGQLRGMAPRAGDKSAICITFAERISGFVSATYWNILAQMF